MCRHKKISKVLALSIALFYFLAPVFNHWVEGLNDFWSFCVFWFFAVFVCTGFPLAEILRPGSYKEYYNRIIDRSDFFGLGSNLSTRPIFSSRYSFVSEDEHQDWSRLVSFSWFVLLMPLIVYIYNLIFD